MNRDAEAACRTQRFEDDVAAFFHNAVARQAAKRTVLGERSGRVRGVGVRHRRFIGGEGDLNGGCAACADGDLRRANAEADAGGVVRLLEADVVGFGRRAFVGDGDAAGDGNGIDDFDQAEGDANAFRVAGVVGDDIGIEGEGDIDTPRADAG